MLGGTSERSKAEHMLQSAAGFIQRQVGRVLTMRRTPTLRFHFDASLEEARRLDQLIAGALERDKEINSKGQATAQPTTDDEEPGDLDQEESSS